MAINIVLTIKISGMMPVNNIWPFYLVEKSENGVYFFARRSYLWLTSCMSQMDIPSICLQI